MKFNFFKKIWGKKEKEENIEEKQEKEEIKKIPVQAGFDFKVLPLITEKSLFLSKQGKFSFLVDNKLNKIQIKEAIEKIFNVNVVSVKTNNYKKRIRGVSRLKSVRPKFKKAIVELKKGQTISIFE